MAAVAGGGLGIALAALPGLTPAWPWAIATALLGALWAWRGGHPWAWVWGYLALWPWPDGRVAVTALAATLAGTALLTPRIRAWLTPARVALGLAVAAFALYVATLAPGLLPADSGEFQLVAATLGIAHPPGYPLYTLLGWLFTRLTPANPAWGLNLLSAVIATLTLVVVVLASGSLSPWERSRVRGLAADDRSPTTDHPDKSYRSSARRPRSSSIGPSSFVLGPPSEPGAAVHSLAALAGALALMGATTFWSQATTANIRILVALFTAVILWLALRAIARPTVGRLAALAVVGALAATHHGSLVFPLAVAALAVAWAWARARRRGHPAATPTQLVAALLVGALGLLPWLYLPLRGAPGIPPQPDSLRSLDAWLNHALARGFGGDMFAFARPALLPDRLRILADILRIQFGWPLLLVAVVGFVTLVRRGPVALLLGAGFAVPAFVAVTYRAPQTVEYMLPAYVALALLIAAGGRLETRDGRLEPGDGRRNPQAPIATLQSLLWLPLVVALVVWNIAGLWPSFAALHRDDGTRQAAEALLRATPPDAPVLAGWHPVTPLWYLQLVEGQRPDVTIDYVAPAGAEEYPATWQRRLAAATQRGPAVATNRYPGYDGAPFTLAPLASGFLAQRGDPQPPAAATRLDIALDGSLRLDATQIAVGPNAPPTHGPPSVDTDDTLVVDLYWSLDQAAPADTSFYVHLVDAAGRVVGQADTTRRAADLGAGRHLATRHTVTILPDTPPGVYHLIAGAYRSDSSGVTQLSAAPIPLADVTVRAPTTLPITQRPLRAGLADGVTLVGADWDTSLDAPRLLLRWRRDASGPPATITATADGAPLAEMTIAEAPAGSILTTTLDTPPAADIALSGGRGSITLGRPSDARWLDFGGEMALLDAPIERRGDELVVNLDWLALRPLSRDYSVSVKARGPGWSAQSDGTPAGGAIPTLKWTAGMRVPDRRVLRLPQDAPGPINVTVSVYDAFTGALLGVRDDRLLKLGQGEEAVIGQQ